MTGKPHFRRDLFRGTATYYERYRAGYPQALVDDLLRHELSAHERSGVLRATLNFAYAANHDAEHGRAIEAASPAR